MARRPSLCYATAGKYSMDEIKDSLSLLDVVYEDQFEGEFFSRETVEWTEENFYRGAPPTWLNFHISDQAESDGTGTPFIKRDGYQTHVGQIHKRREGPGTSTIKLLHQQGCGGTTLAMQVLWDLRKIFRCAVLTGSTLDIRKVAKQVVHLFTGGRQGHQKIVLLLLNDDLIVDRLQDSIMEEIVEQELEIDMPVVIFLSCMRTSEHVILKKEQSSEMKQKFKKNERKYVILKTTLSDTEKQQFSEKKEELSRRYGDRCKLFHGFNILQSNFSHDYILEACETFKKTIKKRKKTLKIQLAAFLSLLNAYVPGSYLLESQCLDFLKHDDDIHGYLSMEDLMKPFSYLIVTFQQDGRPEKKVRMVHPLIAQRCIELMTDVGVTRSDTGIQFLTCFCQDEVPPCTFGFIKDMLTKREVKKDENMENANKYQGRLKREDTLEKFSRLILDIKDREDNKQSASLLKVASNKFVQNSVFPQALARFYYRELKDYNKAEIWAVTAKQRDPKKSFIADTLGQVHKHHLKNTDRFAKPREILQLAQKAIEAFEDEEQLAANEHGKDMDEDGKTKELRAFNSSGQFGYLQVCNLLYYRLVSHDEVWKQILTKNVPMASVLESLGDNKLINFNGLINSLRDMVEKKVEFFDTFLTYSESVMKKDNEPYISRETAECYKRYVGDSAPKQKDELSQTLHSLKQKLAATSAGVLSCLDRRCSILDVKNIAAWWKEICQRKDSSEQDLANYVLANNMLTNMKETPSSSDYLSAFKEKAHPTSETVVHMLALLVFWLTDDEDKCVSDLRGLIKNVQQSYKHEYKTLFQSRYLRPLFFIGIGKGMSRFIHRRALEILWLKNVLQDSNTNWRNESIFKDPAVQEHLLKVEGEVRNYRLYAMFRGTEIEVEANQRGRLWKSGQVSFYLGFTIKGPIAFSIQRKTTTKGKPGGRGDVVGSSRWNKLVPEVETKDDIQTYSLQSSRGCYECSVSALRWICKERVSITYQFCSWDGYRERPACRGYMPAGPLLNISVKAGKLEMMQLPHWIDHDSTSEDNFAVLHVDTCGDSVQPVSEVTASHVRLLHPTFSPTGVIIWMKLDLPVKVYCDAMIFKTKREFLTLRVYLVPPDRDLQQKVEKKEESYGSIIIPKPNPDKSLQMWDHFVLTTDPDAAVQPDKLKLRYERTNHFEVFIRDADSDLFLKLEKEKRNSLEDTVWTCTIRKGDYQNTCSDDVPETKASDQHFVDLHL